MITVSVCLIVKNEEAVLARCLDGLRTIADELVVVDTGSTDRTMEIARAYTDQLHTFEWMDDFAAARNFAFSCCNMEYIYSADADEVLDEENQRRFQLLKQALVPEVEIVQMKYANQLEHGSVYNFDEEYRPKLFKRLRTFRWISPIHETVVLNPMVYDSDLVIQHCPQQANTQRDIQALERVAARGQMNARLRRMYASELMIAGSPEDFLAAREYFAALLKDSQSLMLEELIDARCIAARAARLAGDFTSFLHLALQGAVGATPAELCCEIGDYFLDVDDPAQAAGWYYTAAYGAQSALDVRSSGRRPLAGLAECCRRSGEFEEAARYQTLSDSWKPDSSST